MLKFETNDCFSFRGGESFTLRIMSPADDHKFAVMAAAVPSLPSPSRKQCETGPVESCAIVGAQFVNGEWQWMQLGPSAKEAVGDVIFDHDLPKNTWLTMVVGSLEQIEKVVSDG